MAPFLSPGKQGRALTPQLPPPPPRVRVWHGGAGEGPGTRRTTPDEGRAGSCWSRPGASAVSFVKGEQTDSWHLSSTWSPASCPVNSTICTNELGKFYTLRQVCRKLGNTKRTRGNTDRKGQKTPPDSPCFYALSRVPSWTASSQALGGDPHVRKRAAFPADGRRSADVQGARDWRAVLCSDGDGPRLVLRVISATRRVRGISP